MKLEKINEEARTCYNRYFKNAYDHKNSEGMRKEMSYVEMMDMIHNDIEKTEAQLEELHMIKHVLEHDAKQAGSVYFGKDKEIRDVHHDSIDEMQAKLNENMASQLAHMNTLKQETMSK